MFPTNRGLLLLLLAAPLITLATWGAWLEWAAGLYLLAIIALLALDWRLAGPVSRFDVGRQHDNRLSLGAENPIRLWVRSRRGAAVRFWLRDEPPDDFKIERRISSGAVIGGGKWESVYYVRPLRRGDYRFGDLTLRWIGPLGLVVRQGKIPAAGGVKVYPNLLDVRRYDLLLRRNQLEQIGLRHTRRFGEGADFERLREYLPDDEYRRINWKATARRHRPVTIEYQTERSQTIIPVLDVGRMMRAPVEQIAKLDYAINAVLFLAYVASGKGDNVGLMTFADEVIQFLSPRQGRAQFYRMLELLYSLEPQPVEPNYARALSYLALKQRKRALIVIFTDLSGGYSMDELVARVAPLSRRSLPLVVTISDPDIHAAARQPIIHSLSVYERAVAGQFLEERRAALDTLNRQGALTLDVAANQLSIAVINRYLELKGKSLL